MEEKKGFKKVNMEDLDKINGGIIVEVNDSYWAYSDDGNIFHAIGFRDADKAAEIAKKNGWSTQKMTAEEFEKKFGNFDDPSSWRPVQ